MLLIYHETATGGEIATNSAKVAGEPHPPRRYKHNGHFVELNGPDYLVAHDANDICKIAGYRLATPQEQEIYEKQKRKASRITERNAAPITPDDELTKTTKAENEETPHSRKDK